MKLPFPMLGLDVDNDSAFINQTVLDYCNERKIELTRSRPYKKNDQAWIEQKNGSVVRRLVGYGRLEGAASAVALGVLHEAARWYVNFFQPSFKLKSKSRDGAKVTKAYHIPATPYERLLSSDRVTSENRATTTAGLRDAGSSSLVESHPRSPAKSGSSRGGRRKRRRAPEAAKI